MPVPDHFPEIVDELRAKRDNYHVAKRAELEASNEYRAAVLAANQRGFTQVDIADVLGIARTTVQDLIRAANRPQRGTQFGVVRSTQVRRGQRSKKQEQTPEAVDPMQTTIDDF